jgi:maleate isomerase
MTEYAFNGLFGVLTPQANTTAEPEIQILAPPGMVGLSARMTSTKPDMDARLEDYVDRMGETVAQFANAPLKAVSLACTGMSYIVSPERERAALDRIAQDRGYPVITAAASILTALEMLEARRVGILSPYGDSLHEKALAFWAARGLEIVRVERLSGNEADFHPIYGMGSDAATRGVEALGTDGLEAIVILGTGLPTLRCLRGFGGRPLPILTPNLAVMWRTALVLSGEAPSRDGLAPWLSGAAWQAAYDMRMPANA